MDAQDFRNLQEAYMEVVENQQLDEGKVEWDSPKRPLESGLTPREKNRAKRKSIGDTESPRYKKLQAAQNTQKGTKVPANKRHKFEKGYDGDTLGQERRLTGDHKHYMPDKKRMKHYTTSLKEPKESFDIYDIILSHLLDEGYAETPEAAEAIMVNMSEEWRESIVEEVLNEAEGSYGATPKAYGAARQTRMTAKRKPFLKKMLRRTNPANRTDSDDSPRKGMTSDDRERARAGAAHGVGTRQDHDYPSEGPGGVTKSAKKLRKQKAMGEHG